MYCFQATIARNAKDTAHTKAERNILESIRVRLRWALPNISSFSLQVSKCCILLTIIV